MAIEHDSDIDNIDPTTYKGIYFNDNEEKWLDPHTGAHFKYEDMYKRLEKVASFRKSEERNNDYMLDITDYIRERSVENCKRMSFKVNDLEHSALNMYTNLQNEAKEKDNAEKRMHSRVLSRQQKIIKNINLNLNKTNRFMNVSKFSNLKIFGNKYAQISSSSDNLKQFNQIEEENLPININNSEKKRRIHWVRDKIKLMKTNASLTHNQSISNIAKVNMNKESLYYKSKIRLNKIK